MDNSNVMGRIIIKEDGMTSIIFFSIFLENIENKWVDAITWEKTDKAEALKQSVR